MAAQAGPARGCRKYGSRFCQKISNAFLRYLGVFFLIMLLSAVLTSSLHLWLGWSDNTAKIPVDIVLFFVSYHLQRRWVFQKKPATAG